MKTHGMKYTMVYRVWCGMKNRCYNSNDPDYHSYGGRGIKICDEWLHSFERFFSDMGNPPSKSHSIDRINNSGNYSFDNCRWATSKEQSRNTRRNILLTLNGRTMCMRDWELELGGKNGFIRKRLKRGWTIQETLTVSRQKSKHWREEPVE